MRQPTGTVTMLFSDIEGSTRLLEVLGPERYAAALERHRQLMRAAFERHQGYEVDCEGDAFFVAFARANEALRAAAEAQAALAAEPWPGEAPIRVRMGIHSGEPMPAPPKYVGMDVHKAARIMAAGHGGQVLVSETTAALFEPGDKLSLVDLGEHRLKDLTLGIRLYQLCADGLERDFPALETLDNRRTNLPAQPTALIGRDRELAELRTLLAEARLLTLTGPGGTGKTRLALQLAAEVVEHFPAGVFVVTLAPVRDPAVVVPTIAQTLGVKEQPGQSIEETLGAYLRDRELLLVLDNFEQLVEAAPCVGALLAGAPALRVLVTSREPLRLSGEREHAVPPLDEGVAVELFLERARAVGATLGADPAVVAEVCRRLDHLPLAIELAAARVKLLPVPKLLERLDASLGVLTGGARDLDPRQRTLRRTIEWSYDLLDEEERVLFRRLAAFAGGWTLEAAEAVCAPDGELDVLDGLGSLVDKSLVRQRELDGEPRFSMLETIREYAAERLDESGDAAAIRERHADHVATIADEAGRNQIGPGMPTWAKRLDLETGNVRAALEWGLAHGDPERPLAIVGALYWYWFMRGRLREGERWTTLALERGRAPSRQRVRALGVAGEYPRFRGDFARAIALKEESVALARALGENGMAAPTLYDLGDIALSQGRVEAARVLFEEALALRRELGSELGIAHALGGLGDLANRTGEHERAGDVFGEVMAIAERYDDDTFRQWALTGAADAALGRGDVGSAGPLLVRALTVAARLRDVFYLHEMLVSSAAALEASGRTRGAARLLGARAALADETGIAPWDPARLEGITQALQATLGAAALATEYELGRSLAARGAVEHALAELADALATSDRTGAARA